jgi:hypothetical protein
MIDARRIMDINANGLASGLLGFGLGGDDAIGW